MTKAVLAAQVASDLSLTSGKAREVVQAALHAIADALARGETVRLWGFGTFRTAARPARRGFNPRTGRGFEIPARAAVRFTPGKRLLGAVSRPRRG